VVHVRCDDEVMSLVADAAHDPLDAIRGCDRIDDGRTDRDMFTQCPMLRGLRAKRAPAHGILCADTARPTVQCFSGGRDRSKLRGMKRLLVGLAVVSLLFVSACDPPSTTPAPPAPEQHDPVAVPSVPFAASSSWNTPLPADAAWRDEPGLRSTYWWLSIEEYSIPVVHSAPSDPLVNVDVPASWGWDGGTLEVRIPADVTGAVGTDGALTIVDGDRVIDFWIFRRDRADHATAEAWAQSDRVTGTGWGSTSPWRAAGIAAAGSSELAGLITGDDITAGAINHALQVGLPCRLQAAGPAGDAIASDGCGAGSIHQGDRLGIPAGAPKPVGMSLLGSMIWDALVKFGAFDVNTSGGNAAVNFAADPRSVEVEVADAARGDLDRIMPSLRVLTSG
jgi:hypothetical protein